MNPKDKRKRLRVVQTPGEEIAPEIIAKSLLDISEGIRRIRRGLLNDKAIIILVQAAMGGITKEQIRGVMDALENLDLMYLRKQ